MTSRLHLWSHHVTRSITSMSGTPGSDGTSTIRGALRGTHIGHKMAHWDREASSSSCEGLMVLHDPSPIVAFLPFPGETV